MRVELPGLFDLQVNGFAGVDFNQPGAAAEELHRAIEAMRATGVTRFLPTLITSSLERFRQCAQAMLALNHPAIAGLHMEGPYIAVEDGPRGAHPRQHVIPATRDDFLRRQEAAQGKIVLVTLAPEVPGALALIEFLVTQNIRVALGHTAATPEQIRAAVQAGATLSTHLGNGCAQQLPRHPNFIWEQLAADELHASLIVDGHHLPPATVKAMIRAKTPARTILVSDATAAAASPPGRYELSGEIVELDANGRVAPPGKPWLAGSALSLDRAVANTVKFAGVSVTEAWAMASAQPAAFLGRQPVGKVSAEWNTTEGRFTSLRVTEG